MTTRPPEGRRVRPQAAAATAAADPIGSPAASGAPQRPMRAGVAAAPGGFAPAAGPAGRPVRGRPAADAGAPAAAGRPDRRAAAAPAARVTRLEVFPPRSSVGKHPFFSQLAAAMADLYEVLHAEIAALDAGEPEKLEILRHRKDGLATIYLEALVNLRRDEALKACLGEADREALRQAGDALRDASTENMRRLQARIDTVGDIINSVIEAARTGTDNDLKVYEQNGTVGGGNRVAARLGLDTAL